MKTVAHRASLRRFAALFAALVLFFCLCGGITAAAATKEELQDKLAQLEQKEKAIKSDLAGAKTDLSASQKRKNLLDQQIGNVQEQIDLIDGRLGTLNSQIASKNKAIADIQTYIVESEADAGKIKEQLGESLRAIVKNGNATALQLLLNARSYEDYLLRTKAMQRISRKDQDIIDHYQTMLVNIKEQKAKLEREKATLEEDKIEAEELKKASASKKNQLNSLCAAAQTEVRNLQATVSGYNKQLSQVQKEMEQTDKQITALIQSTQSTGSYNGKMMYWPVPTVRALSDYFGPRWGTVHKGIDIANGPIPIYGEKIVAAADGVVIYANSTNSWGGGYGYYCIVDHGLDSQGRKITTLYAHTSRMYARVGQVVKGGQTVLALAGRSGNVTGPHLHFEVRVNGTPVNPLGTYVSPNVN